VNYSVASGCLLVALALAMPQARADLRGKVHVLLNPEAPRLEWLRAPLPGAYVAVYWSVTIPGPGHAGSSCRYSELARSDERGEYLMDGPNFLTARIAHKAFLVYSAALEPINFPYGGSVQSAEDITMAKSTLTPAQRLSRISGYAQPDCPERKLNDPHHLLEAFHRSLLDEAKRLHVESDEGRTQLQSIEAAARRVAGDKPGGPRVVIMPRSGAIESRPVTPATTR
jgi:hypothetical protein